MPDDRVMYADDFPETVEEPKAGYHLAKIPRGVFGESSKIQEELLEFEDAMKQGVKLMALIELSDLLGAVRGVLDKHFPGTTLEDLAAMSAVTQRAFKAGHRKPR